jgi:ABC-type polysaccharide/polyol phosphate export permease
MQRGGTVWDARELLWSFVRRDLTVRYRHALLGVAWAILTPLSQMLLFSLVFSRIVRTDAALPYPLYAFTGLAAWSLTASALRSALMSLAGNAFLVSKVAFRREVLPLASVVVAIVDFAVTLVMLGVLMWYYGIPLRPTALLLPVVLAVQIALTSGLALLLAAANLWWHDVRHVFDVGITLWMFASAVLYPLPSLQGPAGVLLALNPMSWIIEAYRDVLLRGTVPTGGAALATTLVSVATLVVSLMVFRRAAPRFAEIA